MKKARVGVIGAGIYGTEVLKVFQTNHKEGLIDLTAFSEIDTAAFNKAEKTFNIKGYVNYKEMVEKEKLDGVAVVTPDHLHNEIGIWCAAHKVHMLMQKPLDITSAGAKEIVDAVKKNDILMFVDFHKRYDPGHIMLKNRIKAGKLGRIQYGYVCMEDIIRVPTVWFKSWAHNSSPAWFIGVHFFDLIYWLLESRPLNVTATGMKHKLISMGIDTYDSLQAKFNFENGASITVDSSWILPNNFTATVNQQIRIVGSDGMMEVDTQDRGVVAAFESDEVSVHANPFGKLEVEDTTYGGTRINGYTAESMIHFLKILSLVINGSAVEAFKGQYPDGEDAVVSARMTEALHESADVGGMIVNI